jgi:hypothetical protein
LGSSDLERTTAAQPAEEAHVRLELRSILLLAALVVFIVAIFVDTNALKWMAAGLALFAAAFLVSETGLGRSFGRRRL